MPGSRRRQTRPYPARRSRGAVPNPLNSCLATTNALKVGTSWAAIETAAERTHYPSLQVPCLSGETRNQQGPVPCWRNPEASLIRRSEQCCEERLYDSVSYERVCPLPATAFIALIAFRGR